MIPLIRFEDKKIKHFIYIYLFCVVLGLEATCGNAGRERVLLSLVSEEKPLAR